MATPINIDALLRRLAAAKEVVIDVETSGLDWRRCHVVGHVFTFGSAPDDSIYVPVRHAAGGNIDGCRVPSTVDGWTGDIHPLETEFVRLLDRPELTCIFHHGAFDLKFYYRLGLRFKAKYEDSIINAPLLNEFQSSFSLDTCAKVAGVQAKKTTIYDYLCSKFPEARANPTKAMGQYWRLAGNDPQAVEYAEQDGTTTWLLREWQLKELEKQDLLKVQSVENRVIPVLARMTTRGVKIDEEQLHRTKKFLEDKRDEALRALPDGFNPRSPKAVREVMEQAGSTDWPLTEKGAASFPESWLSKHPKGQQIVRVRKYSNLLNSFIDPMLDTHLWKGRVHSEYNQLRGDEFGTITGRLSSSNPNLQQVSKRDKELGRIHRTNFIPDEGKIWGAVDYAQMEPRLLAYYSRCRVLLDGYRASPSIDAHQAVADATGFDRDTGKRINQSIITGAGQKSLTIKWGMALEQVRKLFDDYFEKMPEVRSLQRRATSVMRDRGYVVSPLGRRARLSDPSRAYVGVNRLLQCGNADCLKIKMAEVDEYLRSEGDRVHLLNNVHDALDFQFEEADRKVYEEACRIMCSFGENDLIKLDVPIEIDGGEGKNWSDATWGPE